MDLQLVDRFLLALGFRMLLENGFRIALGLVVVGWLGLGQVRGTILGEFVVESRVAGLG